MPNGPSNATALLKIQYLGENVKQAVKKSRAFWTVSESKTV